jgi:hypothetical protein
VVATAKWVTPRFCEPGVNDEWAAAGFKEAMYERKSADGKIMRDLLTRGMVLLLKPVRDIQETFALLTMQIAGTHTQTAQERLHERKAVDQSNEQIRSNWP